MNIGKIAGLGITGLTAGVFVNKLNASIHDVDITDINVSNELNRAWLCSEPPNLDKFIKEKPVDLNKQYLCSDYGSREDD